MSKTGLFHNCLATAALAALSVSPAQAEAPRVVASIKPVHSLVTGVMEGVGVPHLFVGGGDSPHTYAMRPSDAQALASADAVFWIGPEFEGFLARPIGNVADEVRSVPLINAPDIVLYAYERAGEHDHHLEGHEEKHGDAHEAHDHVHEGTDGHIWLDPSNARSMVAEIATVLAELDPANGDAYQANATRLKTRLSEMEADITARLEPYQEVGFFTFHDAFRYFAEHFELNSLGAITISPDRQPGAQRLNEIRSEIAAKDRACVFAEPQFPPSLVEVVVEGTAAGTGVVDPLGSEIEDGPELYFNLIEFNAAAFEECLSGA